MRIQDVMSEKVRTIAPSASADAAWEAMRTEQVRHLVVTLGSQVAGLVSERDLGGRFGAPVRAGREVAELMSTNVVTAPPTMPVRKAANLMRGRAIGCLVVTRRGHVVGIVTAADLLDLIGRGAGRQPSAAPRSTLRHRTAHKKRHSATGVW